MRRVLFAGVFMLAAGGQALAADLPEPEAPPPPRAPATYIPVAPPAFYNWSGVYFGINGGYGFGQSDWTGGVTSSGSFSTDGFLVGGTLGGNYQMGAFVVGLEVDGDYSAVAGNLPTSFCLACATKTEWLGTARARVGYAFDRILLYVTGGGAYGNIEAIANGVSNNNSEFGWTGGAGIEAALAYNLTVKLEYLYVDLASGSCTTACGAPPSATQSVSLTESLVRAGINYKF
jgi:outer membrane immunogenic protein